MDGLTLAQTDSTNAKPNARCNQSCVRVCRSLGLRKCWLVSAQLDTEWGPSPEVQPLLQDLGQLVQLRALDMCENRNLTDHVLPSMVRLTNLTALEFSHVELTAPGQQPPLQGPPFYSYAALEQALSALPGICHLVLASDSVWESLSPSLLLRIASRQSASKSTQCFALEALIGHDWEDVWDEESPLAQTVLSGIPPLLAFLETAYWPPPEPGVDNKERFRVQVQEPWSTFHYGRKEWLCWVWGKFWRM